MTSGGHVFISHGSENRDEAKALCDLLEARGIRVWIAPRDVRPGMDYSEQLQLAIEQCTAFAVLVTEKANKSPYVRAETEMAFSTHKPIFPIRTSDIAPAAGLALFLKIRHWTDAFGADREANLERLAKELVALAGGETKPSGQSGPTAPAPTTAPPPAVAPVTRSPNPFAGAPAPEAPPPQASGGASDAGASAPPRPAAALPADAARKPAAAERTPPPPTPPGADDARLSVAVGRNAEYYLRHWNEMKAKSSSFSWNWAACLANLYWFAWRKMWLPLAGVATGFLVLGAVGASNPSAGQLTFLISIGITFLTGAFGNHIYRRHCERLLASTAGMSPEAAAESLKRGGGTSNVALYATIGVTLLLTALSVAGQMNQMQKVDADQEARERVDALFNDSQSPPSDQPAGDDGGKPPADDYYYPDGE